MYRLKNHGDTEAWQYFPGRNIPLVQKRSRLVEAGHNCSECFELVDDVVEQVGGKEVTLRPGDWIVRSAIGAVFVMNDERFRATYEEIKEIP